MILNRSNFLFAIVVVMIAMASASCVDIPDKAPDPPALNAEFRFISVLPDSAVVPSSMLIAEGPNFSVYKSYTLAANATPSNYTTFLSGSKRIVYGTLDTLRLTFDTDQRATVAFMQKKNGSFDALKLPYRYTFAPNGIADTTLVRFTNLILNHKDTIDVYRSDSTLAVGVVTNNNLLFAATSGVVKIPAGRTYKFYFTNYSDTNRLYSSSITISGASRKVYTVFVYDKYDTTGVTPAAKIAKVKVKVLEEL